MNIAKAPVGGMTSKVNGEFYAGGEFMPTHGLFCGVKGAKRLVKWEKAKTAGRTVNLGGKHMFELSEYIGGGVWNILGYAICDTAAESISAFTAKTKIYAKQV